jgi:hypothetical protein
MGRRRRGYGRKGLGISGGGPVKAVFTLYATLIVAGLAYFLALGIANR